MSRLRLRGRDLENRRRDVRQTIGVLLAGRTGGALLERNKLRMRLSGRIILILSRQEELGSRQNNSLNFSMWNQGNNLLPCKLSVPEDPGPTRVGQMQRHDVCRGPGKVEDPRSLLIFKSCLCPHGVQAEEGATLAGVRNIFQSTSELGKTPRA